MGAPSDEAFAKLPSGTLESLTPAAAIRTGRITTFGGEVVELIKTNNAVQIGYKGNTVNVVTADVEASNGVIHVIDNVILPAAAAPQERQPQDVVDVAVNAGSFKTLVKVVSDLGLVETLKGFEAVTIFAPSDEAFAKLPAGTLESLSPEAAKEIILRHVVLAKVPASAVKTGSVKTIGGEVIDLVKTNAGGVQINYEGNTVNVVSADIGASNGVIHVIDNVILPAAAAPEERQPQDVVDVAVNA